MSHIPSTYSVESVTSGHPDKICDQISDAILDACLAQDPHSRVAVEVFGTRGYLVIGGEVTTRACVDYVGIAKHVYRAIGYADNLEINVRVSEQSPDIAMGVDTGGAGDQGIMYGFATDETAEMMPLGVVLAHKLTKGLESLRRSGELAWLGPDGKAQVSLKDGRVETVLVSTQHSAEIDHKTIEQELTHRLIAPIFEGHSPARILINPTGLFVQGGFTADTGLTGRKIMVDTYGGITPHGGGAFSGKDATKVDRSGAYMCRYTARQLVHSGIAKEALVSVAYAIGVAEPVMLTALDQDRKPLPLPFSLSDFTPSAIIARLNLHSPTFHKTSCYGHFGKEGLVWENT